VALVRRPRARHARSPPECDRLGDHLRPSANVTAPSLAMRIASAAARRAPGRPAKQRAIEASIDRSTCVCRACGLVSPSICSANVTVGHQPLRHLNRRTVSSMTTGLPATGASPSRRTYRPCTRHDGIPHPGHLPGNV
jgi:hypothetical protein